MTGKVPTDCGVLLVGHGTREPQGIATLSATARRVAEQLGQVSLELALLEYARPSIADGVAALAAGGLRRLVAVPAFLTAGRHVRHDVPTEIREAAVRHGMEEVYLAPHLAMHPNLLEILAARWHEAIGPASRRPVTTILAARGSRDRRAVAEVADLAERFQAKCPQAEVQTCFFAMCEPRLEAALAALGRSDAVEVVVLPYLTAPGRLSRRLGAAVAHQQQQASHQKWSVSRPLAPDPLFDRAVVELVTTALPPR